MSAIIERMTEAGMAERVRGTAVDEFAASGEPGVLLFADAADPLGRSHDTALALLDVLDERGSPLRVGVVTEEVDAALRRRWHASMLPAVVLVRDGEVLESVLSADGQETYEAVLAWHFPSPERTTTS